MKINQPYTYIVENYIGEFRCMYDYYQNLTFSAKFSNIFVLKDYQVEITHLFR